MLMAAIACMRGDYQQAKSLCQEANRDELFDMIAVGVYWAMALTCCCLGDDDETHQALVNCLKIARNHLKCPLFQYLCLPIAAVLAARQGQSERAVEMLGLAFTQSPNINGWMIKWPLLGDVRGELQAELGTDRFESAWTHGSRLNLDSVMSQLPDITR
jgi:hypothetical protein